MKILVNTRFLLKDQLEGIGLYTYEIMRRLVKARPKDEFIFCFDRPYEDKFLFASNVTPIVVRPPARHALLFWWWYQVALVKIYRKHEVDLLFSPDGFTPLSHHVKKSLLTIHDLAYLHYPSQVSRTNLWFYRKFMPKHVDKADRIITVSNATKMDVQYYFPRAKNKVVTIHNGTRDFFTPLSNPLKNQIRDTYTGGSPYFISVGALHPRKNTVRLLQAFTKYKELTDSDLQLLIVGRDAWKTSQIYSAHKESGVSSDIQFLGYVDDHVLAKLTAASRALIYISLFEGFGLPIAEAMKSGVPVVTSNRSSMQEIAGDAACLVDPEDIDDIVRGLRRVENEGPATRDLVDKGKSRVQLFNWDASAKSHNDLIQSFLIS